MVKRKVFKVLAGVLIASNLIAVQVRAEPLNDYIAEVAEGYNICPEMVEAMIYRESRWVADARNGSCVGLMQINKNIHKDRMAELGVTDLTDPHGNILVGCDLLADLFKKYSDPYAVLMFYNQGYPGIDRYKAGRYSSYATWIMDEARRLERSRGK